MKYHRINVICNMSSIKCHLSSVTSNLSCVKCHLSHLLPGNCHLSLVSFHISSVIMFHGCTSPIESHFSKKSNNQHFWRPSISFSCLMVGLIHKPSQECTRQLTLNIITFHRHFNTLKIFESLIHGKHYDSTKNVQRPTI